MFTGYDDTYDESVRLAILQCLHDQNDFRLTDSMLDDLLVSRYLINRGIGHVRTQVSWLERQAGAVVKYEAGPAWIVELTEAGKKHVRKRDVLPGIKRPN